MATFQVTIRKSAGARRDGMRRVYIRVTHKRKVRYVATEMYVADSVGHYKPANPFLRYEQR